MRPDLLALTTDDLVTLANRGLVRRAQGELEAGELSFELEEDAAGSVTVRWSDGVECLLPAGRTLVDGRCSCPATTLCRHLIRSVLAYQQAAQAPAAEAEAEGPEAEPASPPAPEPWDPGTISDKELARHFHRAALARARRRFDEGELVELVRSAKPAAHLHTLSCSLRFLVPGDPRYTHCDCAEPAPCSHVPLVVWAFRLLDPGQASGLISTRPISLPVPLPLLDDLEAALVEFAGAGVAGSGQALLDRLRRLESRCRSECLVWPAEILAELVRQCEAYASHDARFAPPRVAELAGELCARSDAIRHDTGAVPQLFVRGSSADQATEVGSARLIGLGCGARLRRGGVELAAYLQDGDSGMVVAVCRDFSDPPKEAPEPPKEFWRLAQMPVVKGTSLAALGTGQLLMKGGRRTPDRRFLPGRAPASFNPQAYAWETLRQPLLAESFAELQARLALLPPAALRPRRIGEDLHVCPVAAVEGAIFSPAEQVIIANLRDPEDGTAILLHPYTGRGAGGTEALLARLGTQPEALRFVAGQVRAGGAGLIIHPVALIFQEGAHRTMLQPWIDRGEGAADLASLSAGLPAPGDPIAAYPGELIQALGELLLLGLQRADDRARRHWQDLHRRGAALGFARLMDPVAKLAEALELKRHTLTWNWRPAAVALLETAVLAALAHEAVTG
jgi:hypothetical protein